MSGVPPDERQELRLAVVMTGGVSLAVWMGGVAHEINRLVRGEEPVYTALLELTAAEARVDVISGTSAGGLNGALLATARAHDANTASLRDVWLETGALDRLLRPAKEPDPPSLLRGDYFLAEIVGALQRLKGPARPPEQAPLHLTITGTLLSGVHRGFPDDFGAVVRDLEHRARFTFLRTTERDDFATASGLEKLALAARCSASFPVAFEPVHVSIGGGGSSDLEGIANFAVSRWLVDGGVLVNKPIGVALDAIFAQPAERQVRRVLAYVVPDPGEATSDAPSAGDVVPKIAEVALATTLRIPRNQSVGDELEAIGAQNRRVAARRRRRELVAGLHASYEDLERLAAAVYARYREVRAERLADLVLRLLAYAAEDPAEPSQAWDDQLRVRRRALRDAVLAGLRNLPPDEFPGPGAPVEAWFTTAGTVERGAGVVLDLLRRGLGLARPGSAVRPQLIRLRGRVHELLAWTRAARPTPGPARLQELARSLLAAHEEERLGVWIAPSLEAILGDPRDFDDVIRRVAELLAPARELAQAAYDEARPAVRDYYEGTIELIQGLATEHGVDAALRRLLALEVVDVALGDEPVTEQAVELLQMSADVPNGFDGRDRASQKLAGLQLAHFGAFYKRSWRANDWLWGRLDAAERLVVVLLDPFRLRQLEVSRREATTAITNLALPAHDPEARALLAALGSDEHVIFDELKFLEDPDEPLPPALEKCAEMVSRRLQLDLLRSGMPRLLEAVDDDARADGRPVPDRWSQVDKLSASDAVEHFTTTRIGEQKLAGEQGTDRFAQTVSHAAAVTTAAVGGTQSGLARGRIRFGAPLRGTGLALYAVTDAAVRGSRAGAATVVAAAVAGVGLLGIALFVRLPSILLLLGLALLVAGLGAAFLRQRLTRAAAALLAGAALAVLPRLLFAVTGNGDSRLAEALRPYEAAWVVVSLALGAILMATMTARWGTTAAGPAPGDTEPAARPPPEPPESEQKAPPRPRPVRSRPRSVGDLGRAAVALAFALAWRLRRGRRLGPGLGFVSQPLAAVELGRACPAMLPPDDLVPRELANELAEVDHERRRLVLWAAALERTLLDRKEADGALLTTYGLAWVEGRVRLCVIRYFPARAALRTRPPEELVVAGHRFPVLVRPLLTRRDGRARRIAPSCYVTVEVDGVRRKAILTARHAVEPKGTGIGDPVKLKVRRPEPEGILRCESPVMDAAVVEVRDEDWRGGTTAIGPTPTPGYFSVLLLTGEREVRADVIELAGLVRGVIPAAAGREPTRAAQVILSKQLRPGDSGCVGVDLGADPAPYVIYLGAENLGFGFISGYGLMIEQARRVWDLHFYDSAPGGAP